MNWTDRERAGEENLTSPLISTKPNPAPGTVPAWIGYSRTRRVACRETGKIAGDQRFLGQAE